MIMMMIMIIIMMDRRINNSEKKDERIETKVSKNAEQLKSKGRKAEPIPRRKTSLPSKAKRRENKIFETVLYSRTRIQPMELSI